ncbi:hypothetical protein J0910_01575 [Nocardiopsis sp. CNT-189]|uniref:hypothetical protein n=1 Tax=Nocardiopsis oceanisediminis TaxID=2816862 RepID=UPI003B2D6166
MPRYTNRDGGLPMESTPQEHYRRALDLKNKARERGHTTAGLALRQDALVEAALSIAASLIQQREEA